MSKFGLITVLFQCLRNCLFIFHLVLSEIVRIGALKLGYCMINYTVTDRFQWMLPLISQQMFEVLHFSWAEGEKPTEPDRINIIEKPWPFFYNKSFQVSTYSWLRQVNSNLLNLSVYVYVLLTILHCLFHGNCSEENERVIPLKRYGERNKKQIYVTTSCFTY